MLLLYIVIEIVHVILMRLPLYFGSSGSEEGKSCQSFINATLVNCLHYCFALIAMALNVPRDVINEFSCTGAFLKQSKKKPLSTAFLPLSPADFLLHRLLCLSQPSSN